MPEHADRRAGRPHRRLRPGRLPETADWAGRSGRESKRKNEQQGCSHDRAILARIGRDLGLLRTTGLLSSPVCGLKRPFLACAVRGRSRVPQPSRSRRRSRRARASSPVLTTVTDAQGRLVPNLDREEFTILDNGKPQEITFFQNETQPFTVVVMLDFSAA